MSYTPDDVRSIADDLEKLVLVFQQMVKDLREDADHPRKAKPSARLWFGRREISRLVQRLGVFSEPSNIAEIEKHYGKIVNPKK